MNRKPMRRTKLASFSERRLRELAAQGVTNPSSTFKPKPAKAAKRQRSTGFDPAVVDAILERDGHCCVRCGGACWGERGLDYSLQHRRARGMGGTERPDTNMPQNGILLCGSGSAIRAATAGWSPTAKRPASMAGPSAKTKTRCSCQ